MQTNAGPMRTAYIIWCCWFLLPDKPSPNNKPILQNFLAHCPSYQQTILDFYLTCALPCTLLTAYFLLHTFDSAHLTCIHQPSHSSMSLCIHHPFSSSLPPIPLFCTFSSIYCICLPLSICGLSLLIYYFAPLTLPAFLASHQEWYSNFSPGSPILYSSLTMS